MATDHDLYLISMAARMLDLHPQTLRKYERLGFIRPARTLGSMRLYTRQELERLRLIKHLVDEVGVNLAGVDRLLSVADALQRMRPLTTDEALPRAEARRRLAQEIDRLCHLLGL
jgi:MerR family transcriptional regulator/heat shock protein HspR